MKRILYLASALAIFGACTNEIAQETENPSLGRTIQFDPYVAGQTRTVAFEATADTLATNGFQVYAWNNETAINGTLGLYFSDMYQQEFGGPSIVATDEHEWPGATPLNFLGTYPSSPDISQNQEKAETDEFKGGSKPQTSVHVNTEESAGTKDIMCALAENKSASEGVVNLSFSHILVKVQANIYYDSYYIDPTRNEGPALENITLTGTIEGDYDVINQKWSVATDATSSSFEYLLFNTTESDYFGSSESQPVYEYTTKDSDHPIRASLMLIPAKYTLTVKHNRGDAITSEVDLSDKELDGGEVSSFAGKVVTLNIHISDNHILFAQPTVEPWETGEVIPVD